MTEPTQPEVSHPTENVSTWYHAWMKAHGKHGSEAATVNVIDMLRDFAVAKDATIASLQKEVAELRKVRQTNETTTWKI